MSNVFKIVSLRGFFARFRLRRIDALFRLPAGRSASWRGCRDRAEAGTEVGRRVGRAATGGGEAHHAGDGGRWALACRSLSRRGVAAKSAIERPRRSNRRARITSSLRRRARSISSSRGGRCATPESPSSIWRAAGQPRCRTESRGASRCNVVSPVPTGIPDVCRVVDQILVGIPESCQCAGFPVLPGCRTHWGRPARRPSGRGGCRCASLRGVNRRRWPEPVRHRRNGCDAPLRTSPAGPPGAGSGAPEVVTAPRSCRRHGIGVVPARSLSDCGSPADRSPT